MNIFIEYLTIWSFFKIVIFKRIISKYKNKQIYYIEISKTLKFLIKYYNILISASVLQFQFKLRDTRVNKELIKLKLFRKDLFEFQKAIINSKAYSLFLDKYNNEMNLKNYLNKSFVWEDINIRSAVGRILYISNAVNVNRELFKYDNCLIIINNRPWFDIFTEYASQINIVLEQTNLYFPAYYLLRNIKERIRLFYNFYFKPRQTGFNTIAEKPFLSLFNNPIVKNKPLLFLFGRGDLHFKNDGNHSDFFWQLNSNFSSDNILFQPVSINEATLLKNNKINITNKKMHFPKSKIRKYISNSSGMKYEISEINKNINLYNRIYNHWYALFKTHNVKIILNWYLYNHEHVPINEAITNNDGISAIWQMAFHGTPYIECMNVADIFFSWSKLTQDINRKTGSKNKFEITTGYPKDYTFNLIKKKPRIIREKLESAGATKIIAVFDENSLPDDRWHTGDELQRENYYHVLEKIFEDKKLGVIFKPKHINSIRYRLGPVNELLDKALATGRCFIFEESGRHTTLASPVYAGFNADICIHSHLSGGTAGIECALNNIPVVLIDREGVPHDILQELPNNTIVFNNWNDALDKTLEYLNDKSKIPGFGDWSPYIELFDPFRDGKAAYRIGTFLKRIHDGFLNNKSRKEIMDEAIDRYAKEWGEDKIIANN